MWHTKCHTCTCMPDSFCFSTPTLKNDLYMYVEVVRQGPNPYLFYWLFDRKHSPWFPETNVLSFNVPSSKALCKLAVHQACVCIWDNFEMAFKYIELLSLRWGDLVVSMPISGLRSGFKHWPGTLCCVLGQVTLLSLTVPLSTQVYKWVNWQI